MFAITGYYRINEWQPEQQPRRCLVRILELACRGIMCAFQLEYLKLSAAYCDLVPDQFQ